MSCLLHPPTTSITPWNTLSQPHSMGQPLQYKLMTTRAWLYTACFINHMDHMYVWCEFEHITQRLTSLETTRIISTQCKLPFHIHNFFQCFQMWHFVAVFNKETDRHQFCYKKNNIYIYKKWKKMTTKTEETKRKGKKHHIVQLKLKMKHTFTT